MPILDSNPANVWVFYLPELDAYWREMFTNPTGLDLAKSLRGEQLPVSNFSANIARPGSESMAIHSDQCIVLPAPWLDIWAVNMIWCLARTTKENDATLYIPGSNQWTTWEDVPDDAHGDMAVIDRRLWHTSGSNVTQNEDRAILFAYHSAPHMRPSCLESFKKH